MAGVRGWPGLRPLELHRVAKTPQPAATRIGTGQSPSAEDHMPRVMPAALVGAVLWGLTAMAATAQDVPVPKPAPQPKSGAVSPSPSMRTVTPGPPLPLAPGQPVPGAVV